MSKIFTGHQPNAFPYLGYFYKMYKSDVFVIDDDVQFSSRGYQNYNFIKANGKKQKITIPISYSQGDLINQVQISYANDRWSKKLLKTLAMSYGKSEYFDEVQALVEDVLKKRYERLIDLNVDFIEEVALRMEIQTELLMASTQLNVEGNGNDRNVAQCKKANCDIYLSGIGGKAYNDEKKYHNEGIDVIYSDYKPFEYKQNGYGFIKNLSILDYLYNEGFNIPNEWR